MRLALPGSVLVHTGLLGTLLVGFAWPQPDDAAAPAAVTVSIVPMANVSSNAKELVESDSTVSALSAGNAATSVEPVPTETIEPVQTVVEPVTSATLEPVTETAEPVLPAEVEPVEANDSAELVEPALAPTAEPVELSSSAASPLSALPVQSASAPALEPVSVEELSAAPVPHIATLQRQSAPIVHAPQRPRPQTQQEPRPQPTPQTAGNGGDSEADSVAAAGGAAPQVSSNGAGGAAELARYQSQVIGKLRRSLRRTNGQDGEVVVRFTVLANGQLAGVSVARSSGNGTVDQAGLALVQRAAPFPPIPPAAARANWTFDVPLAFGG